VTLTTYHNTNMAAMMGTGNTDSYVLMLDVQKQ
jgi:hypothetical protein